MVGVKIFFSKDNIMTSILLTFPPIFPGERIWLPFSGGSLVLIIGLICGKGSRPKPAKVLYSKNLHCEAISWELSWSAPREVAGPRPPPTEVTWQVPPGLAAEPNPLILPIHCPHSCQNQPLKRGVVISPGFILFIQWCPPCQVHTFHSGIEKKYTFLCPSVPPRACPVVSHLHVFSHYMESFLSDAFLPPGIFLPNSWDSAHLGSLNSNLEWVPFLHDLSTPWTVLQDGTSHVLA